ncbi:hypothetical protein RP20_CCG025869 [Aedes albopictus]|nr:hypothetical protein RP20_CCG025869 [Aedes albopictus]
MTTQQPASMAASSAANTQRMGSIVLKSLSILLGLFFIFIGLMKLTPHISKDLHRDLAVMVEVHFKVPVGADGLIHPQSPWDHVENGKSHQKTNQREIHREKYLFASSFEFSTT